jgi:hypothetical protein
MTSGTLDESARAIACARWLELRCFEILGGWVPSTAEPEAKLAFARQSHHHAWHADLFARVFPVASGLDVGPADRAHDGWAGALDRMEALTTTPDRLTAVFAVLLPAKLAAYERWLLELDPVRDAPLRRWLGFVVADERADLAEGRDLMAGVRLPGGSQERTAVEDALTVAGPLLG